MATLWRRSWNRSSIPHDDTVWALPLVNLLPGETLLAMWLGVHHEMGFWGPEISNPQNGAVQIHGMILVPPPPTPVPAPLSDPGEDWLMREMAQWRADQVLWTTSDGLVGTHHSLHPTTKFEGQRRNDTEDTLTLHLSVQTTTESTLEFREFTISTVHVEALINVP